MNPDIPYSILWLSPGIQFKFNQILINSLDPIWINGSFNFYKHSAYGLSENLIMGSTIVGDNYQNSYPIFLYL